MTQTPNDRHPDIEIYVKQRSVEQITHWLESVFGPLNALDNRGQSYSFTATYQDALIPIRLINRATKEFSSVWLDSALTPWPQDLACARQAQQQLETEIRCIVSGWKEGDEPDEWWSVTEQGESRILWQG